MFEEILFQDRVVSLLKNDIQNNHLPNSIIFAGSKFSGRLSTAFELARVINCLKDRDISCDCKNCLLIKDLSFNSIILLSRRDFLPQLKEAFNFYKETGSSLAQKLINKIIKLFSMPLVDFLIKDIFNDSDKRVIYSNLEVLNDFISQEKLNVNNFEKVIKTIETVNKLYKVKNIPIDSIRSVLEWSYIKVPDVKKVIIIDHFDCLEKFSQNVLLKRIEEPSEDLYFILITDNLNRVLTTIKSRCRCYTFKKITGDDVNKVLENIYNKKFEVKYESLEAFFERGEDVAFENIKPVLIKLINLVFLKDATFSDLSLFLEPYNDRKVVNVILKYLIRYLDAEMAIRVSGNTTEREIEAFSRLSLFQLKTLTSKLKELLIKSDTYNLNPILILEGIFYPIKAMVMYDKI